ncbi:IS110 family transposase [Schleiferilactobacillus harbinensis]|mgnify:FL=1|jgi:transposase|uniref:IS110 family transposase n=1 Tax=Schleiferilactobacillus harbinensis TaxID=304207 RepID=UPI00116BBF03|nr:IS110 family transposase [Schleiferilactobacillus harbinensis]GEK07726.1 IS110 family transposase [Schleiferilactobacillus harbinensis]
MRIAIGLDVSSKTTNVSVVVNDGEVTREAEACKVSNDLVGFGPVLKLIHKYSINDKLPEVVFEATGVYSRRLQHFLRVHAVAYTQLNPLKAKQELTAIGGLHRRKTDQMDALGLAQSQLILQRAKSYVQDPVYIYLRDAERFYQQINSDVVTAKNRLHRALQLTFPELENVLYSTDGELYWRLVQTFPHPDLLLKSHQSFDQLVETVRHLTKRTMSETRGQRIAQKLSDSASVAAPAVSAAPTEIEPVTYQAGELIRLSDQKHHLINEMLDLAKELPELDIFKSLPGAADTSAVTLLAEFGDLRRFQTTNQINSYIGIDLRHYESGNYEAADHISKRGNPYARKILFRMIGTMDAVAKLPNHPNHIIDYYEKKKQSSQSKGTKKIAIAAVSRLIRTIYYLVTHNQTYDYQKATLGR